MLSLDSIRRLRVQADHDRREFDALSLQIVDELLACVALLQGQAEDSVALEAQRNDEFLAGEIVRLEAELAQLKRGEFICKKCGLRKDVEAAGDLPF